MSNNITIVGNLAADPEVKTTPSGAKVANFRVLSQERIFDRDTNTWRDGDVSGYNCAAWRGLADNVEKTFKKGMTVIVDGTLKVREFTRDDSSKGHSADINVNECGPSIKFATAVVTKVTGGNGGGQAQAPAQQAPAQAQAPAQQAPAAPAAVGGGVDDF